MLGNSKTMTDFFFTLCGYGLGGFWFLPGPGSPGSSGLLSSLFSSTFTLPVYGVTAFAKEI